MKNVVNIERRRYNMTNGAMQLTATPMPIPASNLHPVDLGKKIDMWKRLETLQTEHQTLKSRMEAIRIEVQEIFSAFPAHKPTEFRLKQVPHKVEQPRPLEDKISISVGRALARAIKLRMTPEQCRIDGFNAATRFAKKQNIELPSTIHTLIDKKIRQRFSQM